MKAIRSILLAALWGAVPVAVYAEEAPASAPVASAPAPTSVDAIRQAETPSVAVQAYAKAIAERPGDAGVEDAYVKRMVELGVPDMAEAQADDLVKKDPSNAT